MSPPRLRFAPSPTGYLHIGGARTALFNYLYARKLGGTFVLRVEDTDQARNSQAAVDAIFDGLKWLGLDWDEGPGKGGAHGPYFQTERLPLYKEYAEKLIASGWAYRSYETTEELAKARETNKLRTGRDDFRFDSPWRDGQAPAREGPCVIRFKMPRDEQLVGFDDLVYGHIEKRHIDMDDWVMIRPNGIPTYNFGAAIDDHTMGITHVARGDDHINNTPPQVLVFQALGATPPLYAHLPMILGEDKKKLSKRTGSVSVTEYREAGYLPHALVNFLARMGWSHGDDEVFSAAQLVEFFDFDAIGKSGGVWNKDKLAWLNNHWMRAAAPAELVPLYRDLLGKKGFSEPDEARAARIVELHREKAKTMKEITDAVDYLYREDIAIDDKAGTKELLPSKYVLEALKVRVAAGPFDVASLEEWTKAFAERNTLKLGKVAQPLRVALTGNTVSPPIFDTLLLVGQAASVKRLDAALAWVAARTPAA